MASPVGPGHQSGIDPENLVSGFVVQNGAEQNNKFAVFAGGLTRRNPWVFCFLCIITLGFYACMRKKQVGGLLVTSRRVIHMILTLDASNHIVEYEQTSFFVRNFAHETHGYEQPVYTCGDWLCCIPCCNCICFCRKPVPTTEVELLFFEYPARETKVKGANASQLFISCCMCCCKVCVDCAYMCTGGASHVRKNRVWMRMEVDFASGMKEMTNVLAAILYYHPAKYTQRGHKWDPANPDTHNHPRIRAVQLDKVDDYRVFDKDRVVPLDPATPSNPISTWGLVDGELVYDGFAGRLRLCSCTVCILSILTLGIWLCIIKINYDNCASIRREYFIVTDRRLVRYTLHTTGAKTVPRLVPNNDQGVEEFYLEVSSWVMTAFHTYRYSEESSCLACCGHCCCCAKKDYRVNLYTAFGKIDIQGEGKNLTDSTSANKDTALEGFLKNLMFQETETPLLDVLQPGALAITRNDTHPYVAAEDLKRPGADDDVLLLDGSPSTQHGIAQEVLVAQVSGRPYGSCCGRCLCCVPCRLFTCCCCPRNKTQDLYITTQRLITSATVRVPCIDLVLDTYTEYYALKVVKRMVFKQSFKCNCVGACSCCPVSYLAVDTDNDFEESEEGHETYTIESVTGVGNRDKSGADRSSDLSLEDKARILVAALAIMNAHEEWIMRKRILEHGLTHQIDTEVVPANL